MDQLPRHRILVFLPPSAGRVIASTLNKEGYKADVVCTLQDLERTLPSSDYVLVITTRPDINVVRNLKPVLVVNLEIFFHRDLRQPTSDVAHKKFDTDAFLKRVRALVEPRHQAVINPIPLSTTKTVATRYQPALKLTRQLFAVLRSLKAMITPIAP